MVLKIGECKYCGKRIIALKWGEGNVCKDCMDIDMNNTNFL